MSPALRVFLRALPACGVVAAVFAFVAPVPAVTPKSESLCATLKVWAEQNYRGASPSLDEIAAFDRPHRLAIFSVVSPEARAALWQEQFRRAATRTDLTGEQRALFTEAQAFVTPALYVRSLKDRSEMSAAMAEFMARTTAAFTSQEHRRLLADIGAAAGAAGTRPPSVWDRIARPFGRSAQTEWCQCNGASYQWDCDGVFCVDGPCQGVWGCGMMQQFYCDGMCNW